MALNNAVLAATQWMCGLSTASCDSEAGVSASGDVFWVGGASVVALVPVEC